MEEIDLKNIIKPLWNKRIFIIIVTTIFALVSFLFLAKTNNIFKNNEIPKNDEPLYYAETHFIIGTAEVMNVNLKPNTNPNDVPLNISQQVRVTQPDLLFETYYKIITSKTSLEKIINELELNIDNNSLANLISLSKISDTDLLCLTVAYTDETKIIQIANKLIEEFISNMSKVYSMDRVAIIDEAYLTSEATLENNSTSNIITSSTADTSIKDTVKYTFIATIIGFIISVCIVLFLELLDNTIKDEEILKELSNINILTTINQDIIDNKNEFDVLRIKLPNIKNILITSAETTTNTEYIANNIASSFARVKQKVLVINLNSNKSDLLEKENTKGLLDYINNKNENISKYITKSTINNLDILLLGNNTNNYINEPQLKEIINSLEAMYDTIIINSPDLLNNANTILALKIIKNTIFTTTKRKTKINDFKNTQNFINQLNGNIIETILINNK